MRPYGRWLRSVLCRADRPGSRFAADPLWSGSREPGMFFSSAAFSRSRATNRAYDDPFDPSGYHTMYCDRLEFPRSVRFPVRRSGLPFRLPRLSERAGALKESRSEGETEGCRCEGASPSDHGHSSTIGAGEAGRCDDSSDRIRIFSVASVFGRSVVPVYSEGNIGLSVSTVRSCKRNRSSLAGWV